MQFKAIFSGFFDLLFDEWPGRVLKKSSRIKLLLSKILWISLSSLLEKLSLKNLIIGHTVYKRFYEIGSMKGLKETKKYLKNYEL